MSNLPIGTVSAFAGQVNPISGTANNVWSSSGCGSSDPQPGEESPFGPINNLETQGWMLCDGRPLAISEYAELFGAIGNLYGQGTEGNGGDHFLLPDYRGLYLRGNDAGAGLDPDAADRLDPTGQGTANVVGSLQCDALQDHNHDYNTEAAAALSDQGQAAAVTVGAVATTAPNPPARIASETRSKNIAVNYIIKYR